ncbi:MAG: 3-oxoacyl-[acyl-carrier-protein] reductase [Paracoccaceae bacterium]
MFDLTGRVALVTGASGGIGSAIAKALHAQGATVALSGTREGPLAALVEELGGRAHAVPCDLADREAVDGLVKRAEEAAGPLDILVNNAGITRDQLFLRLSEEDWARVMEVNLTAAYRLSKQAIRGMMKRRHGRIVQITSIVGHTGNPGQGNYAAAKAGLAAMSKSLAAEVAPRGVTVNCVAPGFIETAMTDKLDEKSRERLLDAIPAGRMGAGEDVAGAVVYLASGAGSYVTGQTIHVNGGMAMI